MMMALSLMVIRSPVAEPSGAEVRIKLAMICPGLESDRLEKGIWSELHWQDFTRSPSGLQESVSVSAQWSDGAALEAL
jgi:hypothetical protein